MKEFKAIIAEYKKTDLSIRRLALATVVKVRGSSYRSPGARMLIRDDGKCVGSISGGCLEGDALRKARQVMSTKKATMVTYDTREESNQNLGISLGCNGVIDVLIEPIDVIDNTNQIAVMESLVQQNKPVVIATGCSADSFIGEKLIIHHDGRVNCTIGNNDLTNKIEQDLIALFDSPQSKSNTYVIENKETEFFLELVQPTISLVIFGGGFDARPVSQLAATLGWDVTVTDECAAHLAPVFFPDAKNLSLCHREVFDREISVTPFTACLLMSHNYEYDRDVLKKIAGTETPYIGILGPRKRFDKMLEEFKNENIFLDPETLNKIHSPVGLDIGAETPDEIALSIISEIQGKFSKRSGGFLKYRQGPIHLRDLKSDQVFKQVYINPATKNNAAQ